MKKIFTLSLSLLAVTAFAAGMKSNKVGNGSFPAATKTTQDAYLQAQGIPPEDQARCAAAGYPATTPTCPQTNLSISSPNAEQLKVGQTFQLPTSGGNGVGAVHVSASGSCTSSGSNITVSAPGVCTISAYKAGGGAYAAGAVQNTSFTTNKGVQSVTFSAATPTAMQTLGTLQLASTSSTGGAVIYTVADNTICSITNLTTLTAKSQGDCTITATSAATANYEAGTAQATISISGQPQTSPVTASISPSSIRANQTGIIISGSGGDGTGAAVYSYSTLTPLVCDVSGNLLSTVATPNSSTCRISVVRQGSGAYINSSAYTIDLTLDTSVPTVPAGTGPFTASVVGSASGTPAVFTFQASDNSSLTYTISSGLSGFNINQSTGVVTKTGALSASTVSGKLRATDTAGNYVERDLSVAIAGDLTLSFDNSAIIVVNDVTSPARKCNTNNWGTMALVWSGASYTPTLTVGNAVGNVSYTCTGTDYLGSCQMYNETNSAAKVKVKFNQQVSVGTGSSVTITATSSSGQTKNTTLTFRCAADVYGNNS